VISTSVLGNKKAAIGLAKQNIVFIGQDKTLSFKDLQIFHSTLVPIDQKKTYKRK
jgi:hypothetical protein